MTASLFRSACHESSLLSVVGLGGIKCEACTGEPACHTTYSSLLKVDTKLMTGNFIHETPRVYIKLRIGQTKHRIHSELRLFQPVLFVNTCPTMGQGMGASECPIWQGEPTSQCSLCIASGVAMSYRYRSAFKKSKPVPCCSLMFTCNLNGCSNLKTLSPQICCVGSPKYTVQQSTVIEIAFNCTHP